MKVLLIDNYDSFTYNLVHYLEKSGAEVVVYRNDAKELNSLIFNAFDGLVLSPGPGLPEESGQLMSLVAECFGRLPILGVCLGMQALVLHTGGQLYNRKGIMHGRSTTLKVLDESVLLNGVTEYQVGLYHSWAAEQDKLTGWTLSAVALEEGVPMVIESKSDKAYGVQFHPESVLTPQGLRMITNWLTLIIKNQ